MTWQGFIQGGGGDTSFEDNHMTWQGFIQGRGGGGEGGHFI